MFAKEEGKNVDPQLMDQRVRDAVREVVKHQHDCGIAVVSDGEMSKLSYATYVTERLSGFGGSDDPMCYILTSKCAEVRQHDAVVHEESSRAAIAYPATEVKGKRNTYCVERNL